MAWQAPRGAPDARSPHQGTVATIRYTSPSIQRFFGSIPNKQLDLELKAADQVWVGDITYLKVGDIYRYLAVVMDQVQPARCGWSYGPRKDVKLTLQALDRAVRATPARIEQSCSTPIGALSTLPAPSSSVSPSWALRRA